MEEIEEVSVEIKGKSPEKIVRNNGAELVYEREITLNEY